MFRYRFHIGDYSSHTGHLTPIEDLAYRRLIDLYYMREGPIGGGVAEIARVVRLQGYEADVERVLDEFFDLVDGAWHHGRCEREIQDYRVTVERNRENGRRGGRPRGGNPVGSQSVPSGNPLESLPVPSTLHPEPSGSPSESSTRTCADPKPPDDASGALAAETRERFERFWEVYDHKVEKKAAVAAWKELRPDFDLAMRITTRAFAYVQAHPDRKYRKHPHRWLRGRCWEDEHVGLKPTEPSQNGFHAAVAGRKP